MTVPTSDNREEYLGNGSTTVFDYAFKIFRDEDLDVYLVEGDSQTLQTLGTDYTVSGAGSTSGGSITMTTAPTSSQTLVILRIIAVTQETDLRNQGDYYPETVEDEMDRSRMIDQQQEDKIARSLQRPEALNYWDAENRTIRNVGDAAEADDAVNKGQMDARFADDVITKTGSHWDGKGLQVRNFAVRSPVQDGDLPNMGAVKAYFTALESGELGDTSKVTAEGTTDQRALAAWTKYLLDVGDGDVKVDTVTGTDQPLAGALNGRAIYVSSISALTALDTAALVDGQQALVDSYNAGSGYGGGQFYWDAASEEATNGWSIFGAGVGRWKRRATVPHATYFGLAPGGSLNSAVGTAVANGTISVLVIDVDCIVTAVTETAAPLIVDIATGVTIDVQTDDGIFNVNAAPFSLLGHESHIEHTSRVLFFGNDATKTFEGIEISGLNFTKKSINERTTLYFPNTITQNVCIKDITAKDNSTPTTAKFIEVQWGSNNGTRDWVLDNILTDGYGDLFRSGGSGFGDRLTARNIKSINSTGQGWQNYHFRRAIIDLHLESNASPAYIWAGDSLEINVRAWHSDTDAIRIEQLQSNATTFTEGQAGVGTILTWGSNHFNLTATNNGGTHGVKVTPFDTGAASSTMDGGIINVTSKGHSGSAIRLDQESITAALIKRLDLIINATDASGSTAQAIQGRDLSGSFDLRVLGGLIDNSHAAAIDVRGTDPSTTQFRGYCNGVDMSSSTTTLIRTDKAGGLFLVQACMLDDYSKLSASWTGGAGNFVSNCWDRAMNTNVSS